MSDSLVIDYGVMLSIVICVVRIVWICPFFSVYLEVKLVLSVSQPIVLHVPSFCLFNCYVVIGEYLSSGIVYLDWSWRLRMAHLYQTISERDGSLTIVK